MTAQEIRIKHYGDNDSRSYDDEELKLMTDFAKEYHKEQLNLSGVSCMFSAEKLEDAYGDGLDYGMGNGGLMFHLENYR